MPESDPRLDPSTTSSEYDAMVPKWDKIQTLLEGTAAMRAAGKKFLPRHEKETEINYQNRLQMTVLFNMTQMTLDMWVSQPFSEPVKVADDVPGEIKKLLDDVDLQGNDVTVFSRDQLKEGLSKAYTHVLVEYPQTYGVNTLADQRAANLRPYWCVIKPENLIFTSKEVVAGVKVLTHARVRETQTVRDGFAERVVHRIRVFDRYENYAPPSSSASGVTGPVVTVSLYEWQEDIKTKKGKWVQIQAPTKIDIDVIPIETFEADCTKPPIEDIADLNVEHWQSKAEQRSVLTVARFPMLAASGATDDESSVGIGPRQLLHTTDAAGKFYYVEHSGAAIAAGRQDLLDIEEKMAGYGAHFLTKKPGNPTATAKSIDSAEETSRLQDAVVRFNDFLARLLALTAKWMGMDPAAAGSVVVGTDFGPTIDQGGLQALVQARQLRDLGRQEFLSGLQEMGVLPKEFDFDQNDRNLESENSAFSGPPVTGPIHNMG
jgi:hypothetical protein